MCGEVVAGVALGDERAQLYVFPGHFLAADPARQDLFELPGRKAAVGLDDKARLVCRVIIIYIYIMCI